MNAPIRIVYSGHTYSAWPWIGGQTRTEVSFIGGATHGTYHSDESNALRWLSDHSLRKSKAKKLLAAALRGEGEFADPEHKARVK